MRPSVLIFVAASLLAGPSAFAQALLQDPAIDAPVYGDDDDVIVRDYFGRVPRPAPVIIEQGGSIVPGGVVPDYVPLQPFSGADPKLARYSYFVSPDNKVVVVDPASRRVARIISQK